ncbi:hypothetical protein LXL04_006560 [Taraxacum kok-saghyz]
MNKCEVKEHWGIVYVPDKPPFPLHQQPTVKVHAAVIDPKHANTLVRKLNQILPLENLRHVKRVRKQVLDEGGIRLSMMLCLADESDDTQLEIIPQEIVDLINLYKLETFITKVCKYAPISKEEWIEQSKLWPTSYHPPTYNISGITGFSEEESLSVCTFMKQALDLSKCECQIVNAAIIVDPSTNYIIAHARDQVNSCSCFINHEHDVMVSCLNPWQWCNENSSSCSWHPLRHAAIVAIENSSERDRRLFPGSGLDESTDHLEHDLMLKKQKTECVKKEVVDSQSNNSLTELTRPYLCTGYDIYLVWEPCAMCAMALVHQRVKRIFYAFPNRKTGALGSVDRLQGEKSLNHHYAVFQVMLPQEKNPLINI